MPTFGMGVKGGVGVVKIMRDNADDPFTTPNTDTGKFAFNSEQPGNKIGFILDIIVVEPDFTSYPASGGTSLSPNLVYLPPGSTAANCEITVQSFVASGNSFQYWYFFPTYFSNKYGISYMPLVEVRDTTDYVNKNKFPGPGLDTSTGQVSGSGQIYSYLANYVQQAAWLSFAGSGSSGGGFSDNRPAVPVHLTSSGVANPYSRALMTVFALPAMSDDIPDYSGTAVSGQEVVRIDKGSGGIARVALPGYDVYQVDEKRFLLHENRIPAKILAAGEIAVAAGGTAVITTRFALPLTTYMDFVARRDGSTTTEEFQFWSPPYIKSSSLSQEMGFSYVVSGNTITITSTADMDIVIRYMVCANAGAAPTTDGKKILLMGNDGVGDYVQVKRPGSSDLAPNLDDIMIDTRLSYSPLLAEGFLNFNSTDMPDTMSAPKFKGERKRSLVIPNPDGLLLFPKMGAIYTPYMGSLAPTDAPSPWAVWGNHGVGINAGSNSGRSLGFSTWANVIDETHVDLWSGGDNPYTFNGGVASYPNNTLGVRYFIFGIPPAL